MNRQILVTGLKLRGISTQMIAGNRAMMASQPQGMRDNHQGRDLYDLKVIKKNYGIIPLLVIVLGGVAVLSGFIVRNVMTRDDIRFSTKGKFNYEKEQNLDKQRKFIAFNQKFNAPEGLKELYDDLKEE